MHDILNKKINELGEVNLVKHELENKLLDSNQIIADKQKTPESPGQVQQ